MSTTTFEISSMEELNSLIESINSPVVVYFYTDWCTPCQLLTPAIEEMDEEFTELKFVKVNVDLRRDIRSKYGIEVVPACIILNQGKNIHTFYGARSDVLTEILCKVNCALC